MLVQVNNINFSRYKGGWCTEFLKSVGIVWQVSFPPYPNIERVIAAQKVSAWCDEKKTLFFHVCCNRVVIKNATIIKSSGLQNASCTWVNFTTQGLLQGYPTL
ncbi:MAG: hypothetical protein ACTSUE_22460 [Promethearchaeota archaeon]